MPRQTCVARDHVSLLGVGDSLQYRHLCTVLDCRRYEPRTQVVPASVAMLARLDAKPDLVKVDLERHNRVVWIDRCSVARGHDEVIGRWLVAVDLGPQLAPRLEHAGELGMDRDRARHLGLGALVL